MDSELSERSDYFPVVVQRGTIEIPTLKINRDLHNFTTVNTIISPLDTQTTRSSMQLTSSPRLSKFAKELSSKRRLMQSLDVGDIKAMKQSIRESSYLKKQRESQMELTSLLIKHAKLLSSERREDLNSSIASIN